LDPTSDRLGAAAGMELTMTDPVAMNLGGVAVSITFTQTAGFKAAKYSAASRTSSSDARAMGPMRASSLRVPPCSISAGSGPQATGEVGDSGWPWPDIRWHDPHAM
jgi:hypothetical protein